MSIITMSRSAKEWSNAQNALSYLNVADNLPHRTEGEAVLFDHIPKDANTRPWYRRWTAN
jgi:hypothetical protein